MSSIVGQRRWMVRNEVVSERGPMGCVELDEAPGAAGAKEVEGSGTRSPGLLPDLSAL